MTTSQTKPNIMPYQSFGIQQLGVSITAENIHSTIPVNNNKCQKRRRVKEVKRGKGNRLLFARML